MNMRYKVIEANHVTVTAILNEHAANGWWLNGVTEDSNGVYTLFLERSADIEDETPVEPTED